MKPVTTIPSDEIGARPSTTNGSGAGGSRADALPLGPPRSMRSRVPQAVLAGLLIVGGALGALLLFNQYNQRAPAVVVTEAVPHGSQLTRQQLAITEVAVDRGVATLGSLDEVVGRFAANDLSPGELLAPSDVATDDQLVTGGESVVGLLLEPGAYPTTRLVAGDRVDVFAAEGAGELLAADLVVFDVVPSSSDGRTLLVSLVVEDGEATRLFTADGAGGTRLALRGRE
ncbi:MAG: SAF domain-containing protein [Actinomycetota bacterium]